LIHSVRSLVIIVSAGFSSFTRTFASSQFPPRKVNHTSLYAPCNYTTPSGVHIHWGTRVSLRSSRALLPSQPRWVNRKYLSPFLTFQSLRLTQADIYYPSSQNTSSLSASSHCCRESWESHEACEWDYVKTIQFGSCRSRHNASYLLLIWKHLLCTYMYILY